MEKRAIVEEWKNSFWIEAASFIGAGTVCCSIVKRQCMFCYDRISTTWVSDKYSCHIGFEKSKCNVLKVMWRSSQTLQSSKKELFYRSITKHYQFTCANCGVRFLLFLRILSCLIMQDGFFISFFSNVDLTVICHF